MKRCEPGWKFELKKHTHIIWVVIGWPENESLHIMPINTKKILSFSYNRSILLVDISTYQSDLQRYIRWSNIDSKIFVFCSQKFYWLRLRSKKIQSEMFLHVLVCFMQNMHSRRSEIGETQQTLTRYRITLLRTWTIITTTTSKTHTISLWLLQRCPLPVSSTFCCI